MRDFPSVIDSSMVVGAYIFGVALIGGYLISILYWSVLRTRKQEEVRQSANSRETIQPP